MIVDVLSTRRIVFREIKQDTERKKRTELKTECQKREKSVEKDKRRTRNMK